MPPPSLMVFLKKESGPIVDSGRARSHHQSPSIEERRRVKIFPLDIFIFWKHTATMKPSHTNLHTPALSNPIASHQRQERRKIKSSPSPSPSSLSPSQSANCGAEITAIYTHSPLCTITPTPLPPPPPVLLLLIHCTIVFVKNLNQSGLWSSRFGGC